MIPQREASESIYELPLRTELTPKQREQLILRNLSLHLRLLKAIQKLKDE